MSTRPGADGSVAAIRPRIRERDSGKWFFVSLCLHGLALAALVYLTRVRWLVPPATRLRVAYTTMSGGTLSHLAQAIEERAADQIRENVAELVRIRSEMGQIQQRIWEQFTAFEQRQRASAAQDAAEQMERAVQNMERTVEALRADAPVEQVDRYQALAEQAQQRATVKLDMSEFTLQAAAAAQAVASQALQEAKAAHDQDAALRDRLEAQRQNLAQEQARADELAQRLAQATEAGLAQDQIRRAQAEAERQAQRAQEVATALTDTAGRRAAAHQESISKQERALQEQKKALEELRRQMQERQSALAQAAPAGRPPAPELARWPGLSDLEQADLATLYDRARLTEDDIAGTLKEVRAMDLAMVRDIKLADARRDIDVVRPVRPDLDAELLREQVRTGERFQAHKEEVKKALRETNSMVNLAQRMLEMATQSADRLRFGSEAGQVSAAAERPRPELELIIRELAMEDISGRFANLAGAMMAAQQQGQGQQAGVGEEAGAGAPRAGQDIQDLTAEGPPEGAPVRFGAGEGEGPFPQLPPDVPAVGARKLSSSGQPARFAYIDTWYTLGPFPNPDRINIDREFPPDSLIDLDATYIGKDGRTIRWQFVQSDRPQIIPGTPEEYGIWYAYTEFWCDRPRDVWIALGTDDRGVLKINGVPVWISSKRLKGWDIDEVWRKVHFQQGVNRILYRVENGWLYIGFSLVLRLED